jgi:hypothetical protein
MHPDKVRAYHVPVDVLQGQPKVNQGDHTLVENGNRLFGALFLQAGRSEIRYIVLQIVGCVTNNVPPVF